MCKICREEVENIKKECKREVSSYDFLFYIILIYVLKERVIN